ncbi:unnamed protein product [Didymodactylos carnosus]|uniref:B box-type domain-containing protein n=1 Tax=Didymodactylos carnosus TaxID=1234261 RepID=A0A813YB07_9BILA|nr:unnamed protein product [Didymodactylos carnosus]CAF0881653.1 unnamed protein product [Didymodactylos carnosus]CAF3498859.1 unnamed protein product [Didymodactylos carnosus]CAF3667777.1 unnamed protein product [Didymodactylos carnosus]
MASSSSNIKCKTCLDGVIECKGCKQTFCDEHFTVHRQKLAVELDHIICDHDILLEQLFESSLSSSANQSSEQPVMDAIDQWEHEMIVKVKQAADVARQKVFQFCNKIHEIVKKDFRLMANDIRAKKLTQNFAETDLQRWKQQLKQFHHLIVPASASITVSTTKSNKIDWTSLIEIEEIADVQLTKLPLKDTFDFSQLTTVKPRLVLDIPFGEWSLFGVSFNSFLHYRHEAPTGKLWLMKTNSDQTVIKWNNNKITDMCWSIYLNRFVLLALTKIYTYDERTNQIQQTSLESNDVDFWSCTCYDQTLLISYGAWGVHVNEFKMGNTWQTVKQWKIKPDELISVIRFSSNNNYVGLAVEAHSRNWHFELRNRQTTDVIWTIQLDNHDRRRFRKRPFDAKK